MMQITEQTHEEKLKMYLKLSKKELAEMLIQSNKIIDTHVTPNVSYGCQHEYSFSGSPTAGIWKCKKCDKIYDNIPLAFYS